MMEDTFGVFQLEVAMTLVTRIKNYCKNISYFSLFIAIEVILIAVFLTIDLITHGEALDKLLIENNSRFMDYSIHLGFASAPLGTNVYEFSDMACFPPLAFLMYGFLARLGGYAADDPQYIRDSYDNVIEGNNIVVFLVYNLICVLLLAYACSLYFKKRGMLNQIILPAIFILSYPIAFSAMERGNSVFLVAPLIAIALAWRNDTSKVKRELAMILIAVCAGLKLYPALLGLLYLKEKRWKETIRLIIYGAVLFFVPFVFFGGFEAIKSFFRVLFSVYGDIHLFNIKGLTLSLVKDIFGTKADLFATIVQQLYLVSSLIAFICAKNKRSAVLIICCLMALYVSSGWMYTCIYMIPAILVFFQEIDGQPIRFRVRNIPDMMAFVMFLAVFSRPSYIGGNVFIYAVMCIVSSLYNFVTIGATINRKFIRPFLYG